MQIDWFTVIAQILNFLVLVWLLKRLLYQPILDAMRERQEGVRNKLAKADEERERARKEREKLADKQAELDERRDSLLKEAQEDADAKRKQMMEEARAEFDDARQSYGDTLIREKDRFQKELSKQAGAEVIAIVKQVLSDLADSRLEGRMVRKFTQLLEDLDEEEKQSLRAADRPATIRSGFDLDPESRDLLEQAASGVLSSPDINFQTQPSLGCGIELVVGGQKISWNIGDYMDSLESSIDQFITGKSHKNALPKGKTAAAGA